MGVVLYATITVVALLAHLHWEEESIEDVTGTLSKALSWPATALVLVLVGCVHITRRLTG